MSMQNTAGLSTAHQIYLQKQQEHAGLQALRESSAVLLQRVEQLAEMSNIMADGGEGESLAGNFWGMKYWCMCGYKCESREAGRSLRSLMEA